ncbi:MAG: hypothetical protein ACREFS_07620 [Acetobacteraceae bacterium]
MDASGAAAVEPVDRAARQEPRSLAAVERDLIRSRTAEGRNRAKARGQHMGRPPKLSPQQQR